MAFSLSLLDVVIVAVCLWLFSSLRARLRSKGHPPPGPRGWPIIGNLLDVPLEQPWQRFSEWGRKYGGLVSLSMMGEPMIVINSHKAAVDLLDKRSSLYSDRPQAPSLEATGYSNVLPLIPYGDRFREQRRMITQVVGSRALVERFGPLQANSTHTFLLRLLEDPANFVEHIKKLTGASMLLITHGYNVTNEGTDPFVRYIEESSDAFATATLPGAFLIDVIPALQYVPGGAWRKRAAECRRLLYLLRDEPHKFVREQMAKGTALISFTSRCLEEEKTQRFTGGRDYEEEVKWINLSLAAGGSDTTVSTMTSLFLAMTLFPEVQRKAQAEIDAVVGNDRLPSFQDRDKLPYITALCTELLRWMPVGPLAIPHRLTQDDVYEGQFLKKGTLFIPNIWGMLHDPETYASPMDFMPERYIPGPNKPAELDPHDIAFGYGRRSCPGLHVADATIFIATASILSVFTIEKAVENGVPITPPIAQTSGSISHPVPFKCIIKPRSAAAETLIRTAAENNEKFVVNRV